MFCFELSLFIIRSYKFIIISGHMWKETLQSSFIKMRGVLPAHMSHIVWFWCFYLLLELPVLYQYQPPTSTSFPITGTTAQWYVFFVCLVFLNQASLNHKLCSKSFLFVCLFSKSCEFEDCKNTESYIWFLCYYGKPSTYVHVNDWEINIWFKKKNKHISNVVCDAVCSIWKIL